MDSKVLIGLGAAAALAGVVYYLMQPVDTDEPPMTTQKGKPAQKPQPQVRKPEEERKAPTRSATLSAHGAPRSSDLVQYENGVLTTDSLLKVLKLIKERHEQATERLMARFKEQRKQLVHGAESDYKQAVLNFRMEIGTMLDDVMTETMEEYGVSQRDIARYNTTHGESLFMSHMQRMMSGNAKQVPVAMSATALVQVLQEKARLMGEKLNPRAKVSPEDLFVVSLMVTDLLSEQFSVEEEEITAAAAQYKTDPAVQQALSAINAFKPR